MTTFMGYEVLDILPNAGVEQDETPERALDELKNSHGRSWAAPQAAAPDVPFKLGFLASTPAQLVALFQLLDRRLGRAVPIWVPTYRADLLLSSDVAEDAGAMTFSWANFYGTAWGAGAGRHFIRVEEPGQTPAHHHLTACTSAIPNATEAYSIDPEALRLYHKATCRVSFLRLCRLDSDLSEFVFSANQLAELTLNLREIPLEVPA